MTVVAPVPPPPPGPGVQPPFIAPPTDGTAQRRGWSIGLGIAAVLLVCVGGSVGLVAVLVLGSQAVTEQAQVAVSDYLTAIQEERYEDAFGLLCERQQQIGERAFTAQQERQGRLTSFTVGDPVFTAAVEVPATLRYGGGLARSVTFNLEQDPDSGQFEVCGLAG